MNPKLLSIDAKANAPKDQFQAKALWRVLGLACRQRKLLVSGLLATAVFAILHTFSIAGAFPIFQILLEEEGLLGWSDRVVAGQRLGADFAPVTDEGPVTVLKLDSKSALKREGFAAGDRLWGARGQSGTALLHDLAYAIPGEEIDVYTSDPSLHPPAPDSAVRLRPGPRDTSATLLQWLGQRIAKDADKNKLQTLTTLLIALVLVIILGNVFRYFGEILIAEAILRAMVNLRSILYRRTLRLPLSYFSGQETSSLVGRFVQDVQEIQRGLLSLFSRFIREPLRAVLLLTLALYLDWRITIALLVVTPLLVVVFWRVGRSVKKSNRRLLQAYGHMIGTLTTSLQNLRIVKAFTAEEFERKRLDEVDRRVLRQQVKLARLQAFVSPALETVAVISVAFLTVWLAGRVLRDDLSASHFATLGLALSMMFDPLRKVTDVYVRVVRSSAGAERVFQVIDEPIESELADGHVKLEPLEAAIEYVDVTFTYPGAEKPALRDIKLRIDKGETIAIVGPNGCGKTTLVSLLARFFDPDNGTIRYDDVDIRSASLESLRRQIGLVTQEAVVFAGTPAANIAYGCMEPDMSRVEDAAGRASANDFIRDMPRGYAADIGERGSTLSGGQRQRIAIARAIFRNAPVLIFDEATSQIDTESEAKIQHALKDFVKGRTTLIIAHRLSTIQFADRIVVMDDGRITDSGSHSELFGRCSVYRTLCETQFLSEPAPSVSA